MCHRQGFFGQVAGSAEGEGVLRTVEAHLSRNWAVTGRRGAEPEPRRSKVHRY